MPQDSILIHAASAARNLTNLKESSLTVKNLFEMTNERDATLVWNIHSIYAEVLADAAHLAPVDAHLVQAEVMRKIYGIDMNDNPIYQALMAQFKSNAPVPA